MCFTEIPTVEFPTSEERLAPLYLKRSCMHVCMIDNLQWWFLWSATWCYVSLQKLAHHLHPLGASRLARKSPSWFRFSLSGRYGLGQEYHPDPAGNAFFLWQPLEARNNRPIRNKRLQQFWEETISSITEKNIIERKWDVNHKAV